MAAVVSVAIGSLAAALIGLWILATPDRLPSVATWGLLALLALVVMPIVTALCWAIDRAVVQRPNALRRDYGPFLDHDGLELSPRDQDHDLSPEGRRAPGLRQHPPGRLAERARRTGRGFTPTETTDA